MKPIALAAVLLIAACAGTPPARNWSEVQANCASRPPVLMDTATCQCVFGRMAQQMPYERLLALQAQAASKPADDVVVVRGAIGPRTMAAQMASSKDELTRTMGESWRACLKD